MFIAEVPEIDIDELREDTDPFVAAVLSLATPLSPEQADCSINSVDSSDKQLESKLGGSFIVKKSTSYNFTRSQVLSSVQVLFHLAMHTNFLSITNNKQ